MAQPGDLVIAATSEDLADVGKAVAWLGDKAVAVHDDCYIFHHDLDPKYVSYCFQTESFQEQKKAFATEAKVTRLSGDNLGRIAIPVRSADEQAHIVSVLDRFDAFVNDISIGLPAEIAARRRQYEYYQDKLLTFREAA